MHPIAVALEAQGLDRRRVDDYYAPLAVDLEARRARCDHRPWMLGVQGPQGSGKSTLAEALVKAWEATGHPAVTVSVDDFYLTRAEQIAVARAHPGNRALEYRGYPGTHDVGLGERTVEGLRRLGAGERMRVPVYDKSAHHGRGDRAPEEGWRTVTGPLDVVVLEGWCLGFTPVPEETLDEELRAPNRRLAAYASWTRRLDMFVMLDVSNLDDIVRWRVDSERARRQRGEPALSDDDARDYVTRCIPAYRAYLPGLRVHPPGEASTRLVLGADRMPDSIHRARRA